MCRLRRLLGLGLFGLLLLVPGCLEGFETLVTRVRYDPYAQSFAVERVLVGVGPAFLGCSDAASCAEAIARIARLAPDDGSTVPADRLLSRLLASGADDVSVQLERSGDRLDILVRYTATVGSAAADDTFVHVEWTGRRGAGRYSLVVSAQATMDPPPRSRSRRSAQAGADGVDWVETWVLPRRARSVDTEMAVGGANPLFASIPGLDTALASRGLLRGDAPRLTVAAPPPVARAWFFDLEVTGALPPGVARASTDVLEPVISDCYLRRLEAAPGLAGNLFVGATVRGDGFVERTSVTGDLADPGLVGCIERAVDAWTFPPWGAATERADVTLPMVFRVEETARRHR